MMREPLIDSSPDTSIAMNQTHAEDPRVSAFCSPDLPEPFHAFAYSSDIWTPDPFDVASIHADARTRFARIVDRVLEPTGLSSGRMLLLLGDSGSGKTHLMRAFRNEVHRRERGYCGYMQMTAFSGQYGRYVLNNLIDSLDRPYYEPEAATTGLMRLSTALADSIRAVPGAWLERLREGGEDQAAVDGIINEMADRILLDERFRAVDVYLIQALLYLQCDDPRIKARVLEYLRCEDLTPHDRQLLGGIVPCTYPDAPHWVIERLGRVIWAVENVPLLIYVDQLEDVFDLDDRDVKFRKAMAALCDLVSRLPSLVVVISCLSDYYHELKKTLPRPTKDRIEHDPRPVSLQTPCNRDEVVSLVGRRLRFLFEKARTAYRPDEPTFPLPEELVSRLVGLRARDVLLECKLYRERCVEEGKMAVFPPAERDGSGGTGEAITAERRLNQIEQAWNDFRSGFTTEVPADEPELAAILADAIKACTGEAEREMVYDAGADGRFVEVERQAQDQRVDRFLLGVCNKDARGGGLRRQVEELMHRAGELTAVIARSTQYPSTAKAAVSLLIDSLVERGGRKVVVEDTDWRTMLAFVAFRREHAGHEGFAAWQKETRPLTSLSSVRAILDLDRADEGAVGRPSAPREPAGSTPDPRPGPSPLAIGTTTDRRAEPLLIDPSELARHAAFLGPREAARPPWRWRSSSSSCCKGSRPSWSIARATSARMLDLGWDYARGSKVRRPSARGGCGERSMWRSTRRDGRTADRSRFPPLPRGSGRCRRSSGSSPPDTPRTPWPA
jgi:hypothetical protein